MNIELLIDKIYELKQRRDRIASLYDDQIKMLTLQLEGAMKAAKIDRASGHIAQVFPRKVQDVEVTDWAKVYDFVEGHHAFDILQRRLTPSAVIERLNAGELIGGIKLDTHVENVIKALPKEKVK